MSAPKAYKAWRKSRTSTQHEEGCSWFWSSVPINECPCECYEKAIFNAGYYAGRGITPKKRILKRV